MQIKFKQLNCIKIKPFSLNNENNRLHTAVSNNFIS